MFWQLSPDGATLPLPGRGLPKPIVLGAEFFDLFERDPIADPEVSDRDAERIETKARLQLIGHRPTHDSPREEIHHTVSDLNSSMNRLRLLFLAI